MVRARSVLAVVTLALVCLAGVPRATRAEPNGMHLDIEPWAGYAKFAKNINFENKLIYGGTVGIYPYRYFGIEGFLGRISPATNHGTTIWNDETSVAPSVDSDITFYGGDLVINLRPSAPFNPFVLAGWQEGRIKFDTPGTPDPVYANGWQLGGGVKLRLTNHVGIRAEVRDAIWQFKVPPAPTPPGTDGTDNLLFTGGIEFSLGGSSVKADADNDGVPDRKDNCPDTPVGARVDEHGCPIDSDHDGVPDGLDQCADTPAGAQVDARGCPMDSDNDKVWNGIDQCPDTPAGAVVDERGCPKDSDGDGVPDGIDQCADTPRGVQVDARGCPVVTDADNDGVPDDKDLCPNTPANAKVDKDGCPIVLNERETELLDKGRITERMIHFETAKWDILPESRPVLDEIGAILIQWPRLRIEIGGHCDWRGSDAYNQELSEHRANAVLDYLVSKYPSITRDQYTAKGYGESQPVATNKTVEGMAMNRRVEFKVMNPEELQRERERRRTLQKGE
jgi:outer membrane protein OmpA-like peptidoglycan-associated protein